MAWLFLILCVALTAYVLASTYTGYRSKYWPTISGRIVCAYVQTRRNTTSSSKTRYYHPVVNYEYDVNRKSYRSSKIGNYLGFGNNNEFAKEIVRKFNDNAVVKVYYCPVYPGWSVLVPGMNQPMAHSLFLIAGILGILGSAPVLFSDNPSWFVDKLFGVIDIVT